MDMATACVSTIYQTVVRALTSQEIKCHHNPYVAHHNPYVARHGG